MTWLLPEGADEDGGQPYAQHGDDDDDGEDRHAARDTPSRSAAAEQRVPPPIKRVFRVDERVWTGGHMHGRRMLATLAASRRASSRGVALVRRRMMVMFVVVGGQGALLRVAGASYAVWRGCGHPARRGDVAANRVGESSRYDNDTQ